jgi:hypothetical protein
MPANRMRQGNKWTVNELISLEREYELLEFTVQQIAEKHQRSENSILYKLESEGLIDTWNNARGFNAEDFQKSVTTNESVDEEQAGGDDDNDEEYQFVEEDDDDDISDDESDVEKLTERVWSLETSVGEISSMVKNIYSMLSAKQNNKKHKSLRASSASAV